MISVYQADARIPSQAWLVDVATTVIRLRETRGFVHPNFDAVEHARQIHKACETLIRRRPEVRASATTLARAIRKHVVDCIETAITNAEMHSRAPLPKEPA